ncbi:CAP domain-containing protein [Actinoplanes sp. TFC3]|uniref:CAP domain-containing protein n=1 Tax=Actinoplanes sp. TFC3 TaxID=1710355 RepID=UPI000832FFAF|nr:CAP domain-containing protein [Actinoplanes sp. TFC3]
MPTRHRKPSSKRNRIIILATCTLGVLGAGVGVASAQTNHFRPHRPQAVKHVTPSLGPATSFADHRGHRPWPKPTTAKPTKPTTAPTTAAPTTTPPATTPTKPPATQPTATTPPATRPTTAPPPPATTAPTTPPVTTPPSGNAVLDQVLAHINAARVSNGLQPYTLDAKLSNASAAHNGLMVAGCGLSHRCPGEADLGDRFSAAGVSWSSAGENIGQGNAANNDASIISNANGLTDLMLAEVAPNDGHKKNLLSSGFKRIGLAVTRGSDGRIWVTQDFVN